MVNDFNNIIRGAFDNYLRDLRGGYSYIGDGINDIVNKIKSQQFLPRPGDVNTNMNNMTNEEISRARKELFPESIKPKRTRGEIRRIAAEKRLDKASQLKPGTKPIPQPGPKYQFPATQNQITPSKIMSDVADKYKQGKLNAARAKLQTAAKLPNGEGVIAAQGPRVIQFGQRYISPEAMDALDTIYGSGKNPANLFDNILTNGKVSDVSIKDNPVYRNFIKWLYKSGLKENFRKGLKVQRDGKINTLGKLMRSKGGTVARGAFNKIAPGLSILGAIEDYKDAKKYPDDDWHRGLNNWSGAFNTASGVGLGGTALLSALGITAPAWLPAVGTIGLVGATPLATYKLTEPGGEWIARKFPNNPIAKASRWYYGGKNTQQRLSEPLFVGGPSLADLGFKELPRTEKELEYLRSKVLEYNNNVKNMQQDKENALKLIKENIEDGEGYDPLNLDDINIDLPQGYAQPDAPNVEGQSLAERGEDSVGKYIKNNVEIGDSYDVGENANIPNSIPQNGYVQEPTDNREVTPVTNEYGNTQISGGISFDGPTENEYVEEEWNKDNVPLAITHMVNKAGNNSIDGLLTGAASDITTDGEDFMKNLALARLAGGYRRNPYYAQLINRTSNTANLQAKAYQTELAKLKLINELVKQQNAATSQDSGLRGRALMLMQQGLANNWDDAIVMAGDPKAFGPYLNYNGRIYSTNTSYNKEVYKQQQENARAIMVNRLRKYIADQSNRNKLTPYERNAIEILKAGATIGDNDMVDKAIDLFRVVRPELFIGSGWNNMTPDMFVGN